MSATNGTNGGIPPDFLISVVNHYKSPPQQALFRDIVEFIANGEWRPAIEKIRAAHAAHGKPGSDPLKKELPGILFSGTFSYRSADKLLAPSGLICADLDHLDDKLESVRDIIVADPHTLAAFISPTGTGLKVVFRVDPAKPHLESYRAAEQYVRETFGLNIDSACSDVSRLCFVSYDPDAFVAHDSTVLPYPEPLHETPEPVEPSRARVGLAVGDVLPGDDYDRNGDWRALLTRHGWTPDGEHLWVRPGKTIAQGHSATWDTISGKPGRFYCFSNAAGAIPEGIHKPWHLFSYLEAGGDTGRAAKMLHELGYGTQRKKAVPTTIDPEIQAAMDAEAEQEVRKNGVIPHDETAEEQIERITKAANQRTIENSPLAPVSPPEKANQPDNKTLKPFTLWKPSQFLSHQLDPNLCILGPGYVELGQWTSFIGIGGLGKTRLALWLALCQIVSRPWCDLATNGKPQKWVILSTENGIRRWKGDLEKMLILFTLEQRAVIEEHLLILAMTQEETADMNLGNPETVARLQLTLITAAPGALILDPFADMVDGDENKAVDVIRTIHTLRRLILSSCPKAAVLIIHHARTGAMNVAQAGDNFNAGNFGRGSKSLYSSVRCEMQLSPQDRDNSDRFVLSCGKANDCPKFAARCVVFDPEKFSYSVDPNFDLDAWREDVAGKQRQVLLTISDIVSFIHEKCPLPGDETDTKTVMENFKSSGAADRTIQNHITKAIEAGFLRRGKKRWLIKMGSKPLPKE